MQVITPSSDNTKIGKHKTVVKTIVCNELCDKECKDRFTFVKYHFTEVVRFDAYYIYLNNNGYLTQTTKRRMNQTSFQFDLGYHVFQKNKVWYVTFKNKTIPFSGNRAILER
jgi:hypothetical protein